MKNEYLVVSICPKFYVPKLNEEIIKNKNIHYYDKRNDKWWFDFQNIVLKAISAVVDIANLYLEPDSKNKVFPSTDVVVKVIDAITLLGKANHQMKERKDWKMLCRKLIKPFASKTILILNNCWGMIRLHIL